MICAFEIAPWSLSVGGSQSNILGISRGRHLGLGRHPPPYAAIGFALRTHTDKAESVFATHRRRHRTPRQR